MDNMDQQRIALTVESDGAVSATFRADIDEHAVMVEVDRRLQLFSERAIRAALKGAGE